MTHGPFWFRRPSDSTLLDLLKEQSNCELTYDSFGMAEAGLPIEGYRTTNRSVDLGNGRAVFDRAVSSIQHWQVHERAGLLVTPKGFGVTEGTQVVLLLRLLVGYVTVACRVVAISQSTDRWGFVYGTLPHHVERGEELFIVEQARDGMVSFTVRAMSRPGHFLTSVGAPFARAVQRRATDRYLKAMVDLVANNRK